MWCASSCQENKQRVLILFFAAHNAINRISKRHHPAAKNGSFFSPEQRGKGCRPGFGYSIQATTCICVHRRNVNLRPEDVANFHKTAHYKKASNTIQDHRNRIDRMYSFWKEKYHSHFDHHVRELT
jgi:hypothetical protein